MTNLPSRALAELTLPAGFVVRPEAVDFAVWMVLDTISVALAGSRLESDVVRSVGATMSRLSGDGKCTAFTTGRRLSAPAAAAINACAVHSIDFDDSYMAGGVKAHFSSSIIPTALAVGEDIDATGRQFLDAIVRGFEVAARLGHALTPSVVERWHPTGVVGVVGCAAAGLSLPYSIAATLLDGVCTIDQFTDERLRNNSFRSLMQRVRIVGSQQIEQDFGSRVASEVMVTYADGTIESGFAADPLGFPERPATAEQRLSKARGLLLRVLDPEKTNSLIELILTLPTSTSLRPLTNFLLREGKLP